MTAVKVSISLPEELLEHARQLAEHNATTVSALVAESLASRIRVEAGRTAVAEFEAEHGAIPGDLRREARKVLRARRARQTGAKLPKP